VKSVKSMKTPVCIISFNRALYLDSLLHSLDSEKEDFDIVVVDNGSKESLMKSVFQRWKDSIHVIELPGDDWINDEYKAKNAFLDYCKSNHADAKSSLFLQDDMQYVGPKGRLKSIVEQFESSTFLNASLTGVRISTIQSTLSGRRVGNFWQFRDNHYMTTGLHKSEVFDRIGKYSQDYPVKKEYWGRGEDDYHARVVSSYGQNYDISCMLHVPVFVGIWNDPRGHYSFIRDNVRYGHYLPPASGETYYENLSNEEYERLTSRSVPAGFINIARPVGWNYAVSDDGDQKKYSQANIMFEGPKEAIK